MKKKIVKGIIHFLNQTASLTEMQIIKSVHIGLLHQTMAVVHTITQICLRQMRNTLAFILNGLILTLPQQSISTEISVMMMKKRLLFILNSSGRKKVVRSQEKIILSKNGTEKKMEPV